VGLGIALITFSPNTIIRSADVNSNFAALNSASVFNGNASSAGAVNANGGAAGLGVDVNGILYVKQNAGLLDPNNNKFQSWSHFNGSASGTYNHGYAGGATPDSVFISPINNAGIYWATSSGGSTTVAVWLSSNVSFNGVASKFQ
jgi:hypothetical protein